MLPRDVILSSASNVRDLGGLYAGGGRRVRRGRAFRAGALHGLDPADIAKLRALGIARVFDLRSPSELARDGTGLFAGPVAEHVHVPLVQVSLNPFDPDVDWRGINLRDRYLEMLQQGGSAIRAVIEALAGENAAPLVFHCSGGKDRTGVVAAIVLRAIGVPDDSIVTDYSLSERNLTAAIHEHRASIEAMGLEPEVLAYLTGSPPERMWYTLGEIDRRWGSTVAYLSSIGVSDDTRNRLRRNLVEPPAA
jgi:protein-tyrosine phosphatase